MTDLPLSIPDDEPRIVPCGFGCGYLADSEADLNDHEQHECENRFNPDLPADADSLPAPRPIRSIPRRVLRPRQHRGGDLR